MKEVEVKILDIDLKKVERTIKSLGGVLVHGNSLYRELYFKTGANNAKFSSMRLRSEGAKVFWTMKFKKGKDKKFLTREELQVEVSDFDLTSKMIQEMGFEPFGMREKYRKEYKIGRTKIELD